MIAGLIALQRLTPHGDLAKEPQGLGLIALLLMVAGVGQGAVCQLTRFCHASRQQMHLTVQEDRVSPAWCVLQQ